MSERTRSGRFVGTTQLPITYVPDRRAAVTPKHHEGTDRNTLAAVGACATQVSAGGGTLDVDATPGQAGWEMPSSSMMMMIRDDDDLSALSSSSYSSRSFITRKIGGAKRARGPT